ncbi:hypothetical protein C8J27_102463 [Rhodobacter aestuarii]|uniref:Dihydroorotate dehydrogenase n=2 Tax=Rhodobacter aestuarii TaxID=453582 RepID=A0A1N7MM79_9RHOB|nr:hypothetical protein C8J27_102463 [Rhodobacter aestuarii]SIS87264.1 hypothetical protein SAMN05421580_10658 [Rhodobacter aestuarii]
MGMTKMHDDNDRDFEGLEAFFTAARDAAPEPEPAFLTQMALQAEVIATERREAEAAALAALVARRQTSQKRGLVATLAAAFGGWGALGGMAGGMATATVAGLWIGLAQAPSLMQSMGLQSTVVASASAEENYLNDADILALALMD